MIIQPGKSNGTHGRRQVQHDGEQQHRSFIEAESPGSEQAPEGEYRRQSVDQQQPAQEKPQQ